MSKASKTPMSFSVDVYVAVRQLLTHSVYLYGHRILNIRLTQVVCHISSFKTRLEPLTLAH